jgi:hypothetical protein
MACIALTNVSFDCSTFQRIFLVLVLRRSTGTGFVAPAVPTGQVAKPLWKYPLDRQAMKDAITPLKRMETISRSKQRDRRPTLDEPDKLMKHFGAIRARRPKSTSMAALTAFAYIASLEP